MRLGRRTESHILNETAVSFATGNLEHTTHLAQVVSTDLAVFTVSAHVANFKCDSISDLEMRFRAFWDLGDGSTIMRSWISMVPHAVSVENSGLPRFMTKD